jgi:hypothetical protein
MKFGKKKKTHFLVLSLSPSDCVITSTYQEWPYILEVLPNEALDNLFQGILALKPTLKSEKRKDGKRVKSSPNPMNSPNLVTPVEAAPPKTGPRGPGALRAPPCGPPRQRRG